MHDPELDLDDVVSASAARSGLSELLNRAAYKGERIGLERHGKVVAVLVSPEDIALLLRLQEQADAREHERRLREDDGERVEVGELLQQLGLDLSQQVDPQKLARSGR